MTMTAEAPATTNARDSLDGVSKAILVQLDDIAAEYNANAATLRAAEGDSQGLLETLRESSTNPEAVELRKRRDKLVDVLATTEQALDEVLKAEVDEMQSEAAGKTAGLDERNKELKSKFNAAKGYLKTLVTESGVDLAEVLPKIDAGRSGSGKGGGTGVRRIRHRAWSVAQGGKSQSFDSASTAAKAVSMDTADFQAAFYAAAGSEKKEDWPESVTFDVTVGELTATITSTRNEPATNGGAATEEVVEEEDSTDEQPDF